MSPDAKRQRHHYGAHRMQSIDSVEDQAAGVDWPAVEADGSLAGIVAVDAALHELSRLMLPSQ